jgi:O-methyltransferase involved in polyketide biosynthesis
VTDKVSVDVSGVAETMLTTLYLKALDADFDRPVLGDRFAKDTVSRLDYDFAATGMTPKWAPLITVRTAQYDIWAHQFLATHPNATVVHLGCGLDSRVFRLDPGPDVAWYDVDYPAVIALREQVFPTRPGYHLIATAATDSSWLDKIPAEGPVLFLAEGISMYLTENDGLDLLRHVVDRFGSGELQIDFYNWLAVKTQRTQILMRRTGSTLHWIVNSPADILGRVDGLRLLTAATLFDAGTSDRAAAASFRAAKRAVRALPPLRRALQYHRYAFGPIS